MDLSLSLRSLIRRSDIGEAVERDTGRLSIRGRPGPLPAAAARASFVEWDYTTLSCRKVVPNSIASAVRLAMPSTRKALHRWPPLRLNVTRTPPQRARPAHKKGGRSRPELSGLTRSAPRQGARANAD